MTVADCSICLDQYENKNQTSCGNCESKVCETCTKRLLDFCKKENDLPRCFDCKADLLENQISGKLKSLYNNVCVNYLLNESEIKDALIKIENQEKFKIKIMQERVDFMRESYPVAIQLVIQLAYAKQLTKITKNNKKQIESVLNKKCMNEVCKKGMLFKLENKDEWKCNLCNDLFCMKCEQKCKETHVCKKEDLESIKLRESFVKCPKCKLPVVKSEGCNDITCSICKTKFHYRTGVIGGHGNHTHVSLKLKDPTSYRLSQLYYRKYSNRVISLLAIMENLEPLQVGNISPIVNMITKLNVKPNKELESQIAKKYMLYKQNKNDNELYFKSLVEIQTLIHRNAGEMELVDALQKIILKRRKYKNEQAIRTVLSQTSEEYKQVHAKLLKSYPKSDVLWMEKIKNPVLSQMFNRSSGSKTELFHGTKEKNIDSITEKGFLTKFNMVSAYGKGTYASPNCQFAMTYANDPDSEFKFMFLCECKVDGDEKKTNDIYCFPNEKAIIPKILVVFKAN